MTTRKRYSVPERCNAPSYFLAANGYKTCRQHASHDEARSGDYDPEGKLGRCNYPMDGLGAARPATCIDWEQAASELQQDYTSYDFDGVTYWGRS